MNLSRNDYSLCVEIPFKTKKFGFKFILLIIFCVNFILVNSTGGIFEKTLFIGSNNLTFQKQKIPIVLLN